MGAKLHFSERQRFRQFWLWLSVGLIDALVGYACISQLAFGKPFGPKPASDPTLVLLGCLVLLLTAALYSVSLETDIGPDGVSVRFPPFIWRRRKYPWKKISAAYVTEYRPIQDFGGWGIKWGTNGTAFSISGKFGIQLVFKDGSKLLIGTAKPEEAEAMLERIKSSRSVG
jgi:hypothetical protein